MKRKLASGKKATDLVLFEKRFEIPDYDDPTGEPSRIRWRILHTPFFGIYLHKWNKPDPRQTLHNHPWDFFSIILKGNYIQRIESHKGPVIDERINWFNYISRKDFHTVLDVKKDTLSLMFVFKTHDDWGYMEKGEYVNFDKHHHSEEFLTALNKRKGAGLDAAI